MRESYLEKKLKIAVEKQGGKALKLTSPGKAGMPDRLILIPGGRVIFVEMKAPGKKLRPLQQKRFKQLQNLGFQVYKIDSMEGVSEFVTEVFE